MNITYIDSHAHIYLDQFKTNISNIIDNSLNNNVQKILMPNINLNTVLKMLDLSIKYEGVFYLLYQE